MAYIDIKRVSDTLEVSFNIYATASPAETTFITKSSIMRLSLNVNQTIEVSIIGDTKVWVFCHYLSAHNVPKIQSWDGIDLVSYEELKQKIRDWMNGV